MPRSRDRLRPKYSRKADRISFTPLIRIPSVAPRLPACPAVFEWSGRGSAPVFVLVPAFSFVAAASPARALPEAASSPCIRRQIGRRPISIALQRGFNAPAGGSRARRTGRSGTKRRGASPARMPQGLASMQNWKGCRPQKQTAAPKGGCGWSQSSAEPSSSVSEKGSVIRSAIRPAFWRIASSISSAASGCRAGTALRSRGPDRGAGCCRRTRRQTSRRCRP